jgi:hypothetical protein
VTIPLALLLLLAPGNKQWSAAHQLGASIPKTWTILKKDDGARAFVVEGPLLGDGKPRLVIWNMGAPGKRSLKQMADSFDDSLRKRAGWTRTALVDHKVGLWPARRIAYSFQQTGKAKGRARVSVILFGGKIVVIEMSGSARGFPATTFDQIEKSLALKGTEVELADEATAQIPAGWRVLKTDRGIRVVGPQDALVILERDPDAAPPPDTKPGGKLEFLGAKRVARTATKQMRGEDVQLRWLSHAGWTGAVVCAVKAWEDAGPGARAILASLKLPSTDGSED